MEHEFGEALRSLRRQYGMSTRGLAAAAHLHPATVGHLETGYRQPTIETARALDAAFGTSPLLESLISTGESEDEVDRRALLGQVAAIGGLSAAAGPDAVADVVRQELVKALAGGGAEDWSSVVHEHSTALITAPSPRVEVRVLADLALARQGVVRGDQEATRAAAQLAMLQGQCRSNRGDTQSSADWYRVAVDAADRSGDRRLAVFVRARQATRLVYEDGPARVLTEAAERGLAMSKRPTIGTLECHVALATAYGRLGSQEARTHMDACTELAAAVEPVDETAWDPTARVLYIRTYVLSRIGTLREAEAACAEAASAGLPAIWAAHARLNHAYVLSRTGDLREGVQLAATVVRAVPRQHRTRIWGQLVEEIVAPMSGRQRARDDVRALRALVRG